MYSLELHINWEIVNYSKEDPMNLITICNNPCYSLPKERGMRDSRHSFIKIGTGLCFTQIHLRWSNISGLTLIIWGKRRRCTSTLFLRLVTSIESLICCSLGIAGIKKLSQSSTPLSSMIRKRESLCGWLLGGGFKWSYLSLLRLLGCLLSWTSQEASLREGHDAMWDVTDV
jgi:hypothetical protein